MEIEGLILDGRYEVIKTLGEGGMGRVYLCKNKRLDMLVAVKEFKREGSLNLISEPHILKKLKHKGIPYIYDIFEENNLTYMVEEYIEGETLENYAKDRNLTIDQVVSIASELCGIIEYLHNLNPPIIYRDLKPTNIIVKKDGHVSLIDFGISRVYKEDNLEDTVYMGSMGYAAPEQCGKGQSCRETDVYGLGAVIYFMINKKAPSNFLEPLNIDVYNKNYGDNLPRIVIRAMSLDVSKRFSNMKDMKQQLQKAKQVQNATILMPHIDSKTMKSGKTVNDGSNIKKKSISGRKKFGLLAGLMAVVIVVMGFASMALGKDDEDKNNQKETAISVNKVQEVKENINNTPIQVAEKVADKKEEEKTDIDEEEDEITSYSKGKSNKGKGNNKRK